MKKKKCKRALLPRLLSIALLTATLSTASGCAKQVANTPDSENVKQSTKTAVEQQKKTEGETTVFTDSIGRKVTIPARIERIAPSGNLSQMMLYSLAPDMLVGLSTKPGDAMLSYYPEKYRTLPVFGAFYGKKANLNKEALVAAQPQVIIDIGEIKKNMQEDLDALQEQLDIPVIFIEAKLENTGEAYRTLGALLGKEKESAPLAYYCDATYKEATEKAASIPEEKKLKVYYGEGGDGLSSNPKGSFHAEVLDLVGAINVAELTDYGKGENQVSLEQLVTWNPDVILFGTGGAYPAISENTGWQELSAVQNKMYFEIPSIPYNWIDRPPAVNRFIGIKWLGNLLYPEIFDYNLKKETKEFYKFFYRYDIKDDEIATMLVHSIR